MDLKAASLFLLIVYWNVAGFAQTQDIIYPKLPKLEVGAGAGGFYLPDYPGSDESRYRFLVLPYVIYRGDILRADRDGGVRGRFFNNEVFDFDLSFDAAFPAKSSDNKARQGMPDLNWTGEIGPRMLFHLHKGRMVRLDLSLPVRYVFSTDFSDLYSEGFLFNPELKFRHRALFDEHTFFAANMGGTWTTEKVMDYFYEVKPQYVRGDRSVYDARGGFMGFDASFFMARRFSQQWMGYIGFRKSYYADSANRKASLLRDIETESYFTGLVWTFYTKGEMMAHPAEEEGFE